MKKEIKIVILVATLIAIGFSAYYLLSKNNSAGTIPSEEFVIFMQRKVDEMRLLSKGFEMKYTVSLEKSIERVCFMQKDDVLYLIENGKISSFHISTLETAENFCITPKNSEITLTLYNAGGIIMAKK
ncbi:MAG: hypothetical protein V1660_03615 [archaeon]